MLPWKLFHTYYATNTIITPSDEVLEGSVVWEASAHLFALLW